MILRKFCPSDFPEILDLFQNTIRSVNCRDYNADQIRVWSSRRSVLESQEERFSSLYTIVAEIQLQNGLPPGKENCNPGISALGCMSSEKGRQIVGYGNIDSSGYLDHLYVHKDFQGRGIASRILEQLESYARSEGCTEIEVHASITAKGFFEKYGYEVLKKQTVELDGIGLENFVMRKSI